MRTPTRAPANVKYPIAKSEAHEHSAAPSVNTRRQLHPQL